MREITDERIDETILSVNSGSHLYGTNTPTSDVDKAAIFIAKKDYYFGIPTIDKPLDFSIIDKLDSGKNTKDAVDIVYYELRWFAQHLIKKSNPNMLELLFVNKENIDFVNWKGRHLLNNAHNFLSRELITKFIGYAKGQRHKMIIRKDKFEDITDGLKFLKALSDEYTNKCLYTVEGLYIKSPDFRNPFSFQNKVVMCGDVKFNSVDKIARVIRCLQERVDKFSNRKELITDHGYDTKFASHLIRLLLELDFVLTHSTFEFPLEDKARQQILEIKNGEWTLQQVNRYSEELLIKTSNNNSHRLPDHPNVEVINRMLLDILDEVEYH